MNVSPEKIQRLVDALKVFIHDVDMHRNLTIIQTIDDTYYMQKCEELRLLLEALEEQEEKLRTLYSRMNTHYQEVYCHWKRDYMWLCRHRREVK